MNSIWDTKLTRNRLVIYDSFNKHVTIVRQIARDYPSRLFCLKFQNRAPAITPSSKQRIELILGFCEYQASNMWEVPNHLRLPKEVRQ